MDLDGAVDHVVEHLRTPELDDPDLDAGIAVVLARGVQLVHLPRGLQREQTRRLHLGIALRDPVLHHLLLGQDAAVRVAGEGSLAEQVERTPALSEPAHRVMDATRPEALLREREALADAVLATDDVLERHAHVVVDDLRVAARLTGLVVGLAHRGHVADDVHAGRIGGHDDHRVVLVRHLVVAGLHHHDQEVGDRRVRREPLVPVDHPLVAVAHGAGGEQRRVGTRAGFGHAEAAAVLAVEQRLHPLLALGGGAADGDELGVAAVGRLVAEDAWAVRGLPEDLVHQAQLHLAESLPAHVGRQVRRPQALALHLFLQRRRDVR